MRMTRSATAAAAAALLLASGCGSSESTENTGGAENGDSSTPASEAPPPDPGPECDGDEDAAGTHVLRGGSVTLPGGGAVTYDEAAADGHSRQAVLAEGAGDEPGDGSAWTVSPGDTVTLAGHEYRVSQICTYRVVLASADDAEQPAPDPEGDDENMDWPHTVDGRWRMRWHVPDRRQGENGLTVVVNEIRDEPPRADISVSGSEDAFYRDVQVGDTVQIAGQLWRVDDIAPVAPEDAGNQRANLNAHVDLHRLGPA
ncbi:DUF6406 domain-containing protein [Streptomyces sp. 7-21]|uniref:DUF6406 domain-containing protein n=1 Tax=Streptomyces sp. 7-21 TaxID=2802283 RepID=UPI00191D6B7C|nr:DUF6406 domain-containing protein [Streptomyces sp. 7-21]MBL1067918.1 hypothetical protein [Streptomyces sp. 7-21]